MATKVNYNEKNGWKFLTGDVNHRKYGGIWYKPTDEKKVGIDITMGGKRFVVPVCSYYILEMVNFPDATGEKIAGKTYYGSVSSIDLTNEAWRQNIVRALDCYGWNNPGEPLTEQMILESVYGYMGGDKETERTSNNYYKLLNALMEEY